MADASYIFEISPYDTTRLLPQLSKALEKRTELISRERYPGMWKQTDRLSDASQGKTRSGRRSKLMSVLCLSVGIFLLVPGLVKPQELFGPLLVGAAAVIYGIVGLWRGRKNRKNPFDKSAELLLSGKDTISDGETVTVSFTEDGMTIPKDDGSVELVPYSDFECAVETADALLFVYGERVTVLQKRDLTTDNLSELSKLLAEKVAKYHAVK